MEVREPSANYLARPGYKQTEVGVIPDDWEVKRLGELAKISAGATPSRANPRYWNGDIPWITTSEVDFYTISHAEQFITKEGLNNSAAKLLSPGTLLMALYGQGKTRGKVGVLGIQAATNQACAAISLNRGVSGKFVLHFLGSQYEAIRNLSNTGNQENLNSSLVRSISIVLPTKAEQEAIAEALSDADALIESLEQLLAKKRHLKQGAMQELLTGKKRLAGFSGEWELVEAGDIGRFRSGNGFPTKFQGATAGEYPFFKVSDMNNEGNETFMETANNYISETLRKQLGAIAFPANSIVLAKVGAAVFLERKKILVKASCLDNNMAAFVLDARLADRRFIHYLLLNTKLSSLVSTTALPSLSGSVLAAITLVLPPITEQTAIAAILSDMDAEITTLEAKLAKARSLKQGMMQELLTGRIRLI